MAFFHVLALVHIALIDAAGNLETDGDLDGLDVAGDVQRIVAAAGPTSANQLPAPTTTMAAAGKISFLEVVIVNPQSLET